jgi:hypothetical protein
MVGGELVMVRQFERPLLMAGVASSGVSALGSTLEVAVGAGDPPPGGDLVRESLE